MRRYDRAIRLPAFARLARLSGCAFVILAIGTAAWADECLDIWARGLMDAGGEGKHRSIFKPDERFVICMRLGKARLVSVWDTPPLGNPTRLYPNRFTHPNDKDALAGKIEANKAICFGDGSTFPLFFDKRDGLGSGRLSVVATERMEDQFKPEDYVIPGRQISRYTLEAKERSLDMSPGCESKMRAEFKYRVAE